MLAVCPAVPWKLTGTGVDEAEIRTELWAAREENVLSSIFGELVFFFSQTILLWWSPCQWNFKKGKYMRSWWIMWVLDRREIEDYMYTALIKWTFCIQVFQIRKYETPIGACLCINNILKLTHGINICKSLRLLKFQIHVSMVYRVLSVLKYWR